MSTGQVAITAQPISTVQCQFTVDRPLLPDRSYYFGGKESAEGSDLPERLFGILGIVSVLVAHDTITVKQGLSAPWQQVGPQIGAAIRAHVASGKPAVRDELFQALPPSHEIRERVQFVLDTEVNPAVASHGGVIRLLDVQGNRVFIEMGGGCQGCAQSTATLRQGVETAIRSAVPEVGEILDQTNHAAGRNPYYR